MADVTIDELNRIPMLKWLSLNADKGELWFVSEDRSRYRLKCSEPNCDSTRWVTEGALAICGKCQTRIVLVNIARAT